MPIVPMTGGRQVHEARAADAARPDHEHSSAFAKSKLALEPKFGQHHLAAVAFDFIS
jgi:hypothetical protein